MQIEENGHQMGFLRKFMMENAGAACAKKLVEKFGDVKSKNILVFAGLGNNGGDGLVIARHLAGYGAGVTVFLLGEPDNIRSEECSWNWNLLEKMESVKLLTGGNFDLLNNLDKFDIIIDGILGTGISGEIREPQASAITFINKSNAFKLAVDIPSGVDPDTGNRNLPHVNADMTVTFHRMKVGMPKRTDVCGEIFVEKKFVDICYNNIPLPIDCNQTTSQPLVIANMIDSLNVKKTDLVLEIGTGTGYQTALLSYLCKHVFTIEIFEKLINQAKINHAKLNLKNISYLLGDGSNGWNKPILFDSIIISAASKKVPLKLLKTLKTKGKIIFPKEYFPKQQKLLLLKKLNELNYSTQELFDVSFVPLL